MTDPLAPPPRTPWLEVALAALPAALHALLLLGRLHPDELFQSLEVALHRAEGFGVLAWEWQTPPNPDTAVQPWGIRNWAVPGLFAALFRAGDAVGLSSVLARRVLAEVPQLVLHAAMLGAVWRLAARRVGGPLARACLWLVALYGPLLWFGGRTMSESFSTAFLVWGLERLDAEDGGARAWAWGGALLGFAQVTRYGSAAAILPALLWLVVARRWRPLLFAIGGGLLVAAGLGLLDKLTWGQWFHSLVHYLRFNLLSGSAAAQFGASPWWSYAPRLLLAPFAVLGLVTVVRKDAWRKPAGGALLLLGGLAALGLVLAERVPGLAALGPYFGVGALLALAVLLLPRAAAHPSLLVAAALGYLAIVSATAHKEDRFVYPVLVLLTVAGAAPFGAWAAEVWTRGVAPRAAVLLIAAAGLSFFVFPTPFDVQRKEQFQLALKASRGVTGLVIMNEGLWGSPGFFYLGLNVPWCACDFPEDGCFQAASRDPRFNRGLSWSNSAAEQARDDRARAAFEAAGFRLVEQRGQASYFER